MFERILSASPQDIRRKFFQVVKGLCYLHVFQAHIAQIHYVMGESMLPTLNASGDLVLLDRLSARFQKVKVGDIVLAHSLVNPQVLVCKRVLAVEGDDVTVWPEPYSDEIAKQVLVPKGHVWLEGDNPTRSRDSRHVGPFPYALVEGKVCLRIWPPHRWTRF